MIENECVCDGDTQCAHHAYLASLSDLCVCQDAKEVHRDPRYGSTKCLVPGGCKTSCQRFVLPGPPTFDIINKAKHYNSHPSGVEAIDICRHLTGDWFNVFKYVFRADHKNGRQDIEKAIYYAKDGTEHDIPIHAPTWRFEHQQLLQQVIDAETDVDRIAFFKMISMGNRSAALGVVEIMLKSWSL